MLSLKTCLANQAYKEILGAGYSLSVVVCWADERWDDPEDIVIGFQREVLTRQVDNGKANG